MTIARLGQLTAELRTLADVQPFGGGSTLPTLSSTKTKTGGWSYRAAGSGSPAFGLSVPVQSAIRCGFWLNHNGVAVAGSTVHLVTLAIGTSFARVAWNAGTNQLVWQLGYNENSAVIKVAAAVPIGDLGLVDAWRHIGVTFSLAGYCSLYVDGVQVLTYAGDMSIFPPSSTQRQTEITGVYIMGAASYSWNTYAYADDFYVDSYAGEDDAPPSSKRFLFGGVSGAGGAAAQWTAVGAATTWECVDEAVPDGDTTYAKALTAGLRDQYACADVTLPVDHQVRAVIPVAVVRKTDAGIDSRLRLGLHDGSAARLGDGQALPVSYGVRWDRFTAQGDGSAWSEAAANGQQVMLESAGSF